MIRKRLRRKLYVISQALERKLAVKRGVYPDNRSGGPKSVGYR